MKKLMLFVGLLLCINISAQDLNESTNTFFDDSETKEYGITKIFVGGEVAEPGEVDLTALPVHGFPSKDLELKKNGKYKFKGSYFFTGYALHDIVSIKTAKKINEKEFRPWVDLYVIVENDKGDKAVFSWGELFYSKDNFKIIIAKTATGINPSKMTMKWPLPEKTMIVCGNDLSNDRFVSNPTKITVKSFVGEFSKERVEKVYSPQIAFIAENTEVKVDDIESTFEKRTLNHLGYGHGRGYKGVNYYEGWLLKDVINDKFDLSQDYLNKGIAVASAKDGYRVVISIAELLNRNDMDDFMLVDHGESDIRGRYTLLCLPDYFVDRNVRSVEKFEIIKID